MNGPVATDLDLAAGGWPGGISPSSLLQDRPERLTAAGLTLFFLLSPCGYPQP